MRFSDLFSLILDNLNRRKGRVVLTAVGVVIGTAAVVTLVSLGLGLQKNATSQLWGISDLSSIQVSPGYPQNMQGAISESDIKKIDDSSIAKIQAIPGVSLVVIQDYFRGGANIGFERLESYASLAGVNIDDMAQLGLEASQGVTKIERGKVVIGSWIPRNFYNPQQRPNDPPPEPPDLMGKTLKIVLTKWSSDGVESKKTVMLEVVGVLKETRGPSDGNIYLTLNEVNAWNEWMTGKKIDRRKEGYNQLIVKASDPKQTTEITQQINDLGLQAYSPQSTVQGINSFFTMMQVVFGGVGAISLLVAAIGIANTMTMAILERTREIGIMKAIGASNKNILSIFLGEAAGIGFLGGIGGVLLALLISVVINTFASSQTGGGSMGMMGGGSLATVTPWWLPIFSVLFATIVGLLSGLYPALNAAMLMPVNALKYE